MKWLPSHGATESLRCKRSLNIDRDGKHSISSVEIPLDLLGIEKVGVYNTVVAPICTDLAK